MLLAWKAEKLQTDRSRHLQNGVARMRPASPDWTGKKEGNKAGSWAAKTNNVNQWLQIELGSDYTKVTRIVTQGRSDYDQWIKTFKLQYSEDGVNYQFYREQGQTEDKVF